jgi:putative DNA primase/helicase
VAANLDSSLARLKGVRRNGSGWQALCPAHEDRNPSLSVHERDGRILLFCHAGCTPEAVCSALGIELCELFTDATPQSSGARVAATYDYVDEHGKLLFQVVRYEPKGFRQRRRDGKGGWHWNLSGTRRVLYGLPEVLAAKSVLIVEGEKDVETARKLGFVATCNPGGAGKWREEYSESLRGKRIAIIADADEPGRKHAQQVASSLAVKSASLKVLELPGAKDLSEWVEHGGTRDALLEMIRNTAERNAETASPEKTEPRIVLVGADEFLSRQSGSDQPWLVEGLLPAQSQTVWQGRPKVGKSHTMLQMAFDMASSLSAFGHFPVARPIRTAYVELEEPESITKARFAAMLRAHGGQGPDARNLQFFTRDDLRKLKMPSQELLGARLKHFASALRDGGAEVVILVALRKLVYGNLKDPEIAERLNDALDVLVQETGAAIATAHHSRKESADTLEAQGLGHTFLSAHADATFDISRAADGIRKIGREGRYEEDTFFLRKVSQGNGELIRVTDAPPDSRSARGPFLARLASGDTVYQAAKATGIVYATAKRWAREVRQTN